ncbi:MAG: hypothetical protein ACRD3T_11990, partial [Terriglobia bacterium]
MTPEDMDRSITELRDNQVVQGVRLHRIETSLDRLEGVVEQNTLAIQQNTLAIGKLADGMALLQTAMKGMVQTVEGLADRMALLQSTMTGLVQT